MSQLYKRLAYFYTTTNYKKGWYYTVMLSLDYWSMVCVPLTSQRESNVQLSLMIYVKRERQREREYSFVFRIRLFTFQNGSSGIMEFLKYYLRLGMECEFYKYDGKDARMSGSYIRYPFLC